MKYLGSKDRIANGILPIILKNRNGRDYVEPFVGGFNSIDKVPPSGLRIGNDINGYLISLFKSLQNGWIPPKEITKDFYKAVRLNKDQYEPNLVGYVGFCCSYSGKWFGGYAGKVDTKIGTVRNYQDEAFRNIMKQVPLIKDIVLYSKPYFDVPIKNTSIIYCDPPYAGTTEYRDGGFNHIDFWEWCRWQNFLGHSVFVSEYSAPEDFNCVWQQTVKSSLSANGTAGGNKTSVEKLFTL